MRKKFFTLILMLAIIETGLVGCGSTNGNANVELPEDPEALTTDSPIYAYGNPRDLRLVIYYLDPNILTAIPVSVDDLVFGGNASNHTGKERNDENGMYGYKIIVNGITLTEHLYLLNGLLSTELIPAEEKHYLNARIYYFIETSDQSKVFEVIIQSGADNMYVNGRELKRNEVFFEAIIPFLPEDGVATLEKYLGKS